jgi:hypothetical protein
MPNAMVPMPPILRRVRGEDFEYSGPDSIFEGVLTWVIVSCLAVPELGEKGLTAGQLFDSAIDFGFRIEALDFREGRLRLLG